MSEDVPGRPKGTALDVLKQLAREMGIPFLIAAGWVTYSLVTTPDKRNVLDATTIFGGSFFLTCWAFAQWFRVKKQQAVESGLGGIVQKQEALVAELREATKRLEGHASGGDSVGWLMFANPRDGAIRDITAMVHGDYPLIEAYANVIDLAINKKAFEEVQRTGDINDYFKHFVQIKCGTLQPDLATLQHATVPCDTTQSSVRFRVDWTARNGRWHQYIELKRNGDRYNFYTAVKRGDAWVLENPAREQLPTQADGKPDVFWFTEPGTW